MASATQSSLLLRVPSPELCVVFANTAIPPPPALKQPRAPRLPAFKTYGELVAWGREQDALAAADGAALLREAEQRPQDAAASLERALQVRSLVVEILNGLAADQRPPADSAERFSALVAEVHVFQLVGRDADAVPRDVLDKVASLVCKSMLGLLGNRGWVRTCAHRRCRRFVVQGKGPPRMWCNKNTCGRSR